MRIFLGAGDVSWNALERRSDRYGSIRLTNQDKAGNDHDVLFDPKLDELEGKKGKLIAVVVNPVKSPHMGDALRGFIPSTPEKGEEVLFGEGSLFIEHYNRPG